MDLGLTNKVAMIGGASKGLGYAVARALASEGARVSIASRDSAAVAKAAETLTRESGNEALGVAADLSTAAGIEAWHAATMKQHGGVDILFANTGGPPTGTALGFDDAAWQSAFELLLLSVIRTVRLVVPSMRARGGGAILIGTSSTVKEPVQMLALSNVMRSGEQPRKRPAVSCASAISASVRMLVPYGPPTFAFDSRKYVTIASITESGTCVPPGASNSVRPLSSDVKRARTASTS